MADEETPVADESTPKTPIDEIKQWPLSRKISLTAVALASLAFFAFIILQARTADYRLLYANLSDTDASAVIEWLKGEKIPYKLLKGGSNIHIPGNEIYETRLNLAGTGIPKGSGVGFEIFDKQSFGMTDFAQKVNYQRALQGELSRTITSLAPVEGARVMLALPQKRLFKEQQKEATASVIIKLTPGRRLRENQIQGIVHLVAGSIESLEAENVTVINANGEILSQKAPPADKTMTPGMLSFQQSLEKRLENRAQSLLDRALGSGNSLVKITADLNFSQVEKTEETYDPNAVPRSEQTTEESSGSLTKEGGVPGVQANLKGSGGQAGVTNSSTRSTETINYEISKVISRTIAPVGAIKSLSVAVLLNDRQVPGMEDEKPTITPRTAEEKQAVEDMIKSALGINKERGDQIQVVSMPFAEKINLEKMIEPLEVSPYYEYKPYIKYGLLALGGLLVYLLMIRPLLKTLQGSEAQEIQTVEELGSDLAGPGQMLTYSDPGTQMRQEILTASSSPTTVVKAWLSRG